MFSERFKYERKKLGLTQQQIANKLGISRSNVANWENGVNEASNEMLLRCSNLFNCSIDYLLNDNTEQVKEENKFKIPKNWDKISTDYENMEKIKYNLPKGLYDYLELDLIDYIKTKAEDDFGIQNYSPFLSIICRYLYYVSSLVEYFTNLYNLISANVCAHETRRK